MVDQVSTSESEAWRLALDVFQLSKNLPDAWVLLAVIARRRQGQAVNAEALAFGTAQGWFEQSGQRVRLLPKGRGLFANLPGFRMRSREHEHRPSRHRARVILPTRQAPQRPNAPLDAPPRRTRGHAVSCNWSSRGAPKR